MTRSSNSLTLSQAIVTQPVDQEENTCPENMKHPPPMDYLRLDDHYQNSAAAHHASAQDYWFTSSSSLMSLDEFLEQVSYQENMNTDAKTTAEPIVKVDFR